MKKLIMLLILVLAIPVIAQSYQPFCFVTNDLFFGVPKEMRYQPFLVKPEIFLYDAPVIAQEKKADKVEKPKFEIKKFEILESQKLGLADMLARHQRELSERLNVILADLRIAYPDMPENVVLNQKTWVFEARVSVKEEKEIKK